MRLPGVPVSILPEVIAKEDISQDQVYTSYMSALASWDKSLSDTIANRGAAYGDLCFKFVEYDSNTLFHLHYARLLPEYLIIMAKLTADTKNNQDVYFCLMCIIMQTLGKQVNDENIDGWFENRMRAIAARIGGVHTEDWESYRPTIRTLQMTNRSMAHLFEFRRMIVDRMFYYQKEKTKDRLQRYYPRRKH